MIIVVKRGIALLCFGLLIIIITVSFIDTTVPAADYVHTNTGCVIIDPGHGVPDGGAVSDFGTIESTLNLKIATLLKEKLSKLGYKVVMTRTDENGLDPKKKTDMNMRLDIMKNTPADIFVSIHINKFYQSKYRGAEVLYSQNYVQSTLLAQLITDKIHTIDPINQTRSIKQADNSLFLMKNATLPAVIVECGFLSNPEEEQLLSEPEYQDKIADAICQGIVDYYKNVKVPERINMVKSEDFE